MTFKEGRDEVKSDVAGEERTGCEHSQFFEDHRVSIKSISVQFVVIGIMHTELLCKI